MLFFLLLSSFFICSFSLGSRLSSFPFFLLLSSFFIFYFSLSSRLSRITFFPSFSYFRNCSFSLSQRLSCFAFFLPSFFKCSFFHHQDYDAKLSFLLSRIILTALFKYHRGYHVLLFFFSYPLFLKILFFFLEVITHCSFYFCHYFLNVFSS